MMERTRYEATETGVDIVIRGYEGWRTSATHPEVIGKLTWGNIASLMNEAYLRGRSEQRADIREALGIGSGD